MKTLPNTQKLTDIHAEALSQFDRIQGALREERKQCLEDRRFYSIAGAQWEGNLGEQFENKPKFEVNKIHLAVIRIINEYRNNRVTVDFVSKDGSDHSELADVCDGLYRSDEQDSVANEAYDNAFEEAVGGGFGAWRLRACLEDEYDGDDDEKQRVKFEPIFDADSCVFFDLNAKRQDKSDASHCFVLDSMTPEAYEEKYDDDPASWPKDIGAAEFDWYAPDLVYISEYYKVETVKEKIRVFRHLDGQEEKFTEQDFNNDENLEETLASIGSKESRHETVKRRKVHKYILSGGKVLEDNGFIAGKHIPIVPIYGKRWFIDGIERCMGHVRLCKDVQRLKNMQLSKLGEISALSSIEKPILTPKQVAGHQMMWADDNIKDYPYLLVNPIIGPDGGEVLSGPIAYTKSPAIPPAMAALLQLTETDMAEILGDPRKGEKIVSNISGKAVEMIQNKLDMQTFIYMSNFGKGMQRCGEIWLSMARELYVEEGRKMKSVSPDGKADSVELAIPMGNESGETEYKNDLSQASFNVAVDIGPSSSSKKAATVRALTGMMAVTQDPETMAVLSSMALMNLEGEGISDVRDFFRKRLIKMGVVQPTKAETEALMAEMQNQQEDPNSIYLKAASEEAVANAARARASTIKTIADAELSRAKTAETLAKTTETQQNVVKTSVESAQNEILRGIRPTVNGEGNLAWQ